LLFTGAKAWIPIFYNILKPKIMKRYISFWTLFFLLGIINVAQAQDPLSIDNDGKVTINKPATINNARIGDVDYSQTWAGLRHKALSGKGTYAIMQNNQGSATLLNTKAGGVIRFRVNNIDKMTLDSEGMLTFHKKEGLFLKLVPSQTGTVYLGRSPQNGIGFSGGQGTIMNSTANLSFNVNANGTPK
jgi:uncharacterized protein (AIM24 family)